MLSKREGDQMRKTACTGEQVACALRQAESGTPTTEVCRKVGISEQTLYRWKRKYAGMGVAEPRRLRQLEEENHQLQQLVADLTLDTPMAQECMNQHRFASLEEERQTVEAWRVDYNDVRPHTAINHQTAAAYKAAWLQNQPGEETG